MKGESMKILVDSEYIDELLDQIANLTNDLEEAQEWDGYNPIQHDYERMCSIIEVIEIVGKASS